MQFMCLDRTNTERQDTVTAVAEPAWRAELALGTKPAIVTKFGCPIFFLSHNGFGYVDLNERNITSYLSGWASSSSFMSSYWLAET